MTLPSQFARGVPGGSNNVRHRQRRIPLPIAAIAFVAIIAVVWVGVGWIIGGSDQSRASLTPTIENTSLASSDPDPSAVNPLVKEPEPILLPAIPGQSQQRASGSGESPASTAPAPAPDQAGSTVPRDPAGESVPTHPVPTKPVEMTPIPPAAPTTKNDAIDKAENLLQENKPIEARRLLDELLRAGSGTSDAIIAREMLAAINSDLLFSPRVYPNEARTESYQIVSGDSLERITRRQDLTVDWRLLQRINRIGDPRRIRVGQHIKLIRGPFHAVIHKSEYRLDVYAGPPDYPQEWEYVRSFPVGLGEDNGTPTGTFVVRRNSKLINPYWRNPRTGERFDADDPRNPIGERWIGIEGVGEAAVHEGYGLHGTIDPDSIGQNRSMGCVRLNHDDVAMVFELLVEGVSVVEIRP